VGFLDSFLGGVSDVFSGFGTSLNTAFASPLGSAIISTGLDLGIEAARDAIGLNPSTSGSPSSRGPVPAPRILDPNALAEELLFFQPGGPGTEVRGGTMVPLSPRFAAPPPSVPSSQPFGVMPGTGLFGFGGPSPAFSPAVARREPMAAFPTERFASFPPSPSAFALASGSPGFQQAGVAGLARQLPGFIGGVLGGELLSGALAGGGGATPMFRPTMAGARAMFFRTANPVTGQDTWFRPAGRPILWSGDLTACKRVNKVARRAKRKR